jgi:hypothetical protein
MSLLVHSDGRAISRMAAALGVLATITPHLACGSASRGQVDEQSGSTRLLSATCQGYAGASTYSDEGDFQIVGDSGEVEFQGDFRTDFQSPNGMTLVLDTRDVQSQSDVHVSLVSSGGETRTTIGSNPSSLSASLSDALQSIAGVSWHVSQMAPRLLLYDADFMCGATRQTTIVGTEVVRGAECKVVRLLTKTGHDLRLVMDPHGSVVAWSERVGLGGRDGALRVNYRLVNFANY